MLHNSELIHAVKNTLNEYPKLRNIVLDPVMVATSGDALLQPEAVATLRDVLIPYSRVIAPNLPDASMLLGQTIDHQDQLEDAALHLSKVLGSEVSVHLKAGHLDNEIHTDIFYNAETEQIMRLPSPKVTTNNTHGTGCTLSSAIAAHLAKGLNLNDAVRGVKDYLHKATEVLVRGFQIKRLDMMNQPSLNFNFNLNFEVNQCSSDMFLFNSYS